MINVKLPDGSTAQFPDGTPPEQIKAAIQKKFPPTTPGPQASVYDPTQQASPGAFGNNPAAQDMPGGGPQPTFDDTIRSFGANIDQIPLAGPALYSGMRQARATVQGMTPEQVDAETARAREAAPGADLAGKVFYNVAPYAVAGALAPKVFGMGEAVPWSAGPKAVLKDIGLRSLAAAGSNLAIGVPDATIRGASLPQAVQENIGPSLAIGALPGAGATVRGLGRLGKAGLNWASGDIAPVIKAFWNPEKAGQTAVGKAMAADRAAGYGLSPADEALAQANGLDITNLDRGGPATRRLARISKSASQESEAALTVAVDRGAPGVDTANFLTKLVGGSADDIALRSQLDNLGRVTNGKAYAAADAHPNAGSIFTPRIENLMQAPEMQQAIKEAEGTGKTWAAIRNAPAPGPAPFKVAPDGSVISTPVAPPSLKFWDQVQRNLRKQMDALGPQEKAKWSDLNALRNELLNQLDTAVPPFKTARQGASAFFGADNALDAGRQFALQPRNLPEAKAAIAKFSPAERKAFEIGAASSAIDVLKTKDTFASVKQVFGSPASREFWATTLGPARAAQLESFIKVQAIQQASKDAVQGGSHTYDLLLGGGLTAGGFAANQSGMVDPRAGTAAMVIGAARLGRGTLGRAVDKQVLTNVSKLLASGDKAALNKVIANATLSPRWRAALDAVFEGMSAASRGAVMASIGPSAAAASQYPQADTRDYSQGLPPALSTGPRVSPMPQVTR
jgi:hypothetical protein